MKFQDLKSKILESREPKGSFDDSASEVKQDVVQIITKERFGTAQIIESVRKYSSKKVTNHLIEQYHEAASSKEFSTDPIVLDIIGKSQYKFDNKYIFVIDNQAVALSEEVIRDIVNEQRDITSIDDIRAVITERTYG